MGTAVRLENESEREKHERKLGNGAGVQLRWLGEEKEKRSWALAGEESGKERMVESEKSKKREGAAAAHGEGWRLQPLTNI